MCQRTDPGGYWVLAPWVQVTIGDLGGAEGGQQGRLRTSNFIAQVCYQNSSNRPLLELTLQCLGAAHT